MGLRTKFNSMGGESEKDIEYFTLTITTNPSSATCTLTYDGQSYTTKTATVPKGTEVTYTVSASDYNTQTSTVTVNDNTDITVTLSEATYLFHLRAKKTGYKCTVTAKLGSTTYTKTSTSDGSYASIIQYIKKGVTYTWTATCTDGQSQNGSGMMTSAGFSKTIRFT